MQFENIIFILIFSFLFFIMLVLLSNSKSPYKITFLNMFFGILGLFSIVYFKNNIGIDININFFTSSISSILGLPGVFVLLFFSSL